MGVPPPAARHPGNATYFIGNDAVPLVAGKAVRQAAPGSAERIETRFFSEPEWGDLDGDGEDDAAMVLLHRAGGSGSFFYVAAAIWQGEVFQGTNAVLLGDRIAPGSVQIRNGVVIVEYADRQAAEPMATAPSMVRTKYLTLRAGKLLQVPALTDGELVTEGWATIDHEVRTFQPCGDAESLWLEPRGEAFEAARKAYAEALPANAQPRTPVFMTLAGRISQAPTEGFGRDYRNGFHASFWIQAWPRGNCRADRIRISTPRPGSLVRSPLRISGWARGYWFFEADFPVRLRDENGQIVATGIAKAQAPWMTNDFVPFEATLRFPAATAPRRGSLVLVKDNPSDDRSLDDAADLPIFYQ